MSFNPDFVSFNFIASNSFLSIDLNQDYNTDQIVVHQEVFTE